MKVKKLSAVDLFPLLNILAKIGIKELIQEIFRQKAEHNKKAKSTEDETSRAGADVMAQVAELVFLNIGRAQKEINTLLARLCEVKQEEIEALSMSDYMGLLMDFLSQEEFKASMTVIMSSFK